VEESSEGKTLFDCETVPDNLLFAHRRLTMSIQVACKCGKQLRLKDELAGKRIRCPDCQRVLTVEKDEDPSEPPRRASSKPEPKQSKRRPPPSDDDVPVRRKPKGEGRKGSNKVLWLSLAGGGVVVAIVAVVLYFFVFGEDPGKSSGSGPVAGPGPTGSNLPPDPPKVQVLQPRATLKTAQGSNLYGAAISTDGKILVISTEHDGNTFEIWDLEDNQRLQLIRIGSVPPEDGLHDPGQARRAGVHGPHS
jgi:hypothetical protein